MAEIIYNKEIDEVLPERFLAYSVSVLKERAIPDGYDGLKPIFRRVLMAMHGLGLSSKMPYRKCAKTIGEVLGKYHPHGDQSAYEALVGLAQDFNMRYPLVDGSGNFGSVNGEPAAAMRYTEARLSPYGELMLENVEKLSDMVPNFDNSAEEPVTLSSYFPNLLLNPQSGIAVGLAAKFAPHYAKDVYTALIAGLNAELKDKEITLDEIVKIIQAPDFPTGAEIINGSEMRDIYAAGRGTVVLRAKYRLEDNLVVFYEIPYKVTPKSILEDIVKLGIVDIKDVRDESSLKNGLRIVVELRKGIEPEYIIRRLFKDTHLQCGYSLNMTAVMNNRPAANISLKVMVDYYLENLKKTHYRTSQIAKKEYLAKLFVVNTMLKAIDYIDEIIRIVRNEDEPLQKMQSLLGLSVKEAEYIYNMKISMLSKANKTDLVARQDEYNAAVRDLDVLLSDHKEFLKDLIGKLRSIRDSKLFKGDVRRTVILNVKDEDVMDAGKGLVKKEPVIVTCSNLGFIRVNPATDYKLSARNAVGKRLKLRKGEFVIQSLSLTTYDNLLLVSSLGRAFVVPVYKFPVEGKGSSGRSVNSFIKLESDEDIVSVTQFLPVQEELSLVLITAMGFIKRTRLTDLVRERQGAIRVITLTEGDRIVSVDICEPGANIAVFTSFGRGLVFSMDGNKESVRITVRIGCGVRCIRLLVDEVVVAGCILRGNSVFLLTSKGFGKAVSLENIRVKKRNQIPVQFVSNIKKLGNVAGVVSFDMLSNVLIMTKFGQHVLVRPDTFITLKRQAKGVRMITIKDAGDKVVNLFPVEVDYLESIDGAVEEVELC